MATRIKGKNKKKPYTTRYYHDGRQREKSFRTSREEADFRAKFEHDSREQIFVDPKIANQKFAEVALDWLARHPGTPRTKSVYETALRCHVLPEFGDRGFASVAADRYGVERFLRDKLPAKGLGASSIRVCYLSITAVVNEAIRTGRLNVTRLTGIKLPAVPRKTNIPFATHEQIEMMAGKLDMSGSGHTIWLMRGCGLRIGEALGTVATDISNGTLRLRRQIAPDGKGTTPLKSRGEDDYRDIPVPKYVLDRLPPHWSIMKRSTRQYYDYFYSARDYAGLPKTFTPHTLRHIFASNCLAGGIPITDVSKWLGHRSIQVTYGIYGHLVPASWDRARAVLDEEWQS